MSESANDKFTCACDPTHLSACQNQPFFKSHKGKNFCVLHYPGTDKLENFRAALKNKFDATDYDFQGVWFPFVADFNGLNVTVAANFSSAYFSADANFIATRFRADAHFNNAIFCADANFLNANFGATANFSNTHFSASAKFHRTNFKDYVRFAGNVESKAWGETPRLDIQFAQIERPERVSFHTLKLRPHSFINVDSRKFEFVDVDWVFRLKAELSSASANKVNAPHRLLVIALRQLADNAEANHRYYEASRFRYNAFEARRIEKFHGFVPWRLDWWYWLASGYGESVGRAFLVFVALLALFMFCYKRSEFVPTTPTTAPPATVVANTAPPTAPDLPPKRLGWREAALYSFNVSILQKPEPKPKGLWSSFLVALETVLGPAQAALLALAVRRRFMR